MVNEHHELLLELWSRIKSHVSPKERLEVADILVIVFDEFGLVSEELQQEHQQLVSDNRATAQLGSDFDATNPEQTAELQE